MFITLLKGYDYDLQSGEGACTNHMQGQDTYDLSTGGCIHGNINIGMGKSPHIHQHHSAARICIGSYLKTTAISLS